MNPCICGVVVVAVLALVVIILVSFDTLEFQEIGLNYSWLSESVEDHVYMSGRYYLGLGNHFVKFPRVVQTINFEDDGGHNTRGPSLQSRTNDGLNVGLEVSIQYKLVPNDLYKMYNHLGVNYEKFFVRTAIDKLTEHATKYSAHFFFSNRTRVGTDLQTALEDHFQDPGYAQIVILQLNNVRLPREFESAITASQVAHRDINISLQEREANMVTFETAILRAQKQVEVVNNRGLAEAQSIEAGNEAYCKQYNITQDLQSKALAQLVTSAGWTTTQLLEYLKIRTVRDHPSQRTTVQM